MSSSRVDSANYLELDYGLKLGLGDTGNWQVVTKNGAFDLSHPQEFFRVVVLLERPYAEVEKLLNEYAEAKRHSARFPLWQVVSAGLSSESDQWARLALTWVPDLPQSDRMLLVNLLDEVAHSKWASQKTRQVAERHRKHHSAAKD